MINKFFITLVLFGTYIAAFAADLPDRSMTPGLINPEVSQANINSTICIKGYTKTIRPPAYVTNRLKKLQIAQYGYQDINPSHYEEDHLIPLSIGGHPNDPSNLWPQPRISEWNAEKKDILELRLLKMVCTGEIGLDQARKEISEDWISTYKRYVRD